MKHFVLSFLFALFSKALVVVWAGVEVVVVEVVVVEVVVVVVEVVVATKSKIKTKYIIFFRNYFKKF